MLPLSISASKLYRYNLDRVALRLCALYYVERYGRRLCWTHKSLSYLADNLAVALIINKSNYNILRFIL